MAENVKVLKNRDISLDSLRAIGLLLIILAHVNPPSLIFQLRNFDVPLMVLVSGIVFGISSGANKSYLVYLVSRIRRLVFPTWIFLSIFFIFYFLWSLTADHDFPYSIPTITSSYTLISGIGYVWIIRVFLLVALVLPFLLKLTRKFNSDGAYLLFLFLVYIIYEFLYYFYPAKLIASQHPLADLLIQNIIFYLLPFGAVAGLGLVIPKMKRRNLIILIAGFFVLFVLLAVTNNFAFTQNYKYPPRIYYLSYALFGSLLFYMLSKIGTFVSLLNNKVLLFLGKYSLWIFLWHLLFINIWSLVKKPLAINNFVVEYILVLILATLTTYLQHLAVGTFLIKANLSGIGKSLLTDSFLK